MPDRPAPGPDDGEPGDRGDRLVVGFVRALRGAGLAVPVGSALLFAESVGLLGAGRDALYWAGRATLVRRPEDRVAYDAVFDAWWTGGQLRRDPPTVPQPPDPVGLDDGPEEEGQGSGDPERSVRWSAVEILRSRDIAGYDDDEWADFSRLVGRLSVTTEERRARRRRPDRHRRGHPDLRRTVRAALRTDGEPVRRAWRSPGRRPRRLVVLLDVSGSMEPYARALLRFAHAAMRARGPARAEVFTLGTRLTRVTRELSERDADAALAAAADSVADWSGGTRLGEGLRRFNDRWGTRGLARGAVVVVLSDGWDRGDPAELEEEMARLGRVAHRVVWANPLKASPGYAPLARGMAAALPYVDDFVEGHSLASLERLADVVAGTGTGAGHAARRTQR